MVDEMVEEQTTSDALTNKIQMTTPAADGFSWPAEWEQHEQTWMLWPTRPDNWYNEARPGQEAFARVANAIAKFEPVTVCVPSQDEFARCRELCDSAVRVVEVAADDSWCRDTGPTFLRNSDGEVRGVSWQFNAYGGLNGGCYTNWANDEVIADKVCEIERVPCYKAPFILEGGAICGDGEGTVITTEECLLNENRNPGLTKKDVESYLMEYLGAKKVIWLPRGVINDEDTNGHVDNFLCFTSPSNVAILSEKDPNDPQHAVSEAAIKLLENTTDAKGRKLTVHKVQQPPALKYSKAESDGLTLTGAAVERPEGLRMAGSYLNFLIVNGGVIIPGFGNEATGEAVETDRMAVEALQPLFPDRKVVQVATRDVLLGGGNIHCITQQQPKAESRISRRSVGA